jgi:hypothetical protein
LEQTHNNIKKTDTNEVRKSGKEKNLNTAQITEYLFGDKLNL